jgi:hypothetical protein
LQFKATPGQIVHEILSPKKPITKKRGGGIEEWLKVQAQVQTPLSKKKKRKTFDKAHPWTAKTPH